MAQIILDYSANTFKNDKKLIKRGIDEIKKIDSGKHEIVFKTQLFIKAGDNIPCTHESFEYLYEYGNSQGYKVTSSIFDKESLNYLLKFSVPFIKIANRKDLYPLAKQIPRGVPVFLSGNNVFVPEVELMWDIRFFCVSKYPADISDYEEILKDGAVAISDHTETWHIYKKYKPMFYECHYILPDSTGLDAGSFARTPEQLKEIL